MTKTSTGIKISRKDIADVLECTENTVSNKRTAQSFTWDEIMKVRKAFNISMEDTLQVLGIPIAGVWDDK